MKFSVRQHFIDLLAFQNLHKKRRKKIQESSPKPQREDPIADLTKQLHTLKMSLVISNIIDETPSTKTFRLVKENNESLPIFRAGQYISIKAEVNGSNITRPYSISSSPKEAHKGYYDITIRKEEHGFFSEYIWNNWEVGSTVICSGPHGFFYYEPLRDTKEIICLAGGSGITPFRSMIKDIVENDLDLSLTLLYGTRLDDDIIYIDELKELADKSPNIKVEYICSEPSNQWKGQSGFLTADCIKANVDNPHDKTFFICGPQVMYDFFDKELETFQLPPKRIRKEVFGEVKNISEKFPDFPKDLEGKSFEITLIIGGLTKIIPADPMETVLVAIERAGFSAPSECRSGECGFCRSLLVSGDIFISPLNDGRRHADIELNFFHPCSSYPLSNLKIVVPRSP